MSYTEPSENRRLKSEIQRVNEKVENLLRVVKSQSIEMVLQRDLIDYAQHLIQRCPHCKSEWQAELEKYQGG